MTRQALLIALSLSLAPLAAHAQDAPPADESDPRIICIVYPPAGWMAPVTDPGVLDGVIPEADEDGPRFVCQVDRPDGWEEPSPDGHMGNGDEDEPEELEEPLATPDVEEEPEPEPDTFDADLDLLEAMGDFLSKPRSTPPRIIGGWNDCLLTTLDMPSTDSSGNECLKFTVTWKPERIDME